MSLGSSPSLTVSVFTSLLSYLLCAPFVTSGAVSSARSYRLCREHCLKSLLLISGLNKDGTSNHLGACCKKLLSESQCCCFLNLSWRFSNFCISFWFWLRLFRILSEKLGRQCQYQSFPVINGVTEIDLFVAEAATKIYASTLKTWSIVFYHFSSTSPISTTIFHVDRFCRGSFCIRTKFTNFHAGC